MNFQASKRTCDWPDKDNIALVSPSIEIGAVAINHFVVRFSLDSDSVKSFLKNIAKNPSLDEEICPWIKNRGNIWSAWVSNSSVVGLPSVNIVTGVPLSGILSARGKFVLKGVEGGLRQVSAAVSSKVRLKWKEFIIDHKSDVQISRGQLSNLTSHDSISVFYGPLIPEILYEIRGPMSLYNVPIIDQGIYGSSFSNKKKYPSLYRVSTKLSQVVLHSMVLVRAFGWKVAHFISSTTSLGLDAFRRIGVDSSGVIDFETTYVISEIDTEGRSSLKAHLMSVQKAQSRIIFLAIGVEVVSMVIEVATELGMMGTGEYIWIAYDNWLSEETTGLAKHEKSLHGMILIARFSDATNFPALKDYETEFKNKRVTEEDGPVFDVALAEQLYYGLGYDSATAFLTALEKTLQSFEDLSIPTECLNSPLSRNNEKVVDICKLGNSTMELLKDEAYCRASFNASWCVKKVGLIHLLESLETPSLANLQNNPKLLLLRDLGNVSFDGAGGPMIFDESNDKARGYGLIYNLLSTVPGHVRVKPIGTIFNTSLVLSTREVVFGGGDPRDPVTDVPSYLKFPRKACEFLEQEGKLLLTTEPSVIFDDVKLSTVVKLVALTLICSTTVFVIYYHESFSKRRQSELYKQQTLRQNSAAPTFANIFQTACTTIECLQWLGIAFAPRYTWVNYSQLPYKLTSSFGLYIAFDWAFYIYFSLVIIFLLFLVLLLRVHNFFISDFGRVACSVIVLYEKVINGPLLLAVPDFAFVTIFLLLR